VPTQPAYHRALIPAGYARFRELVQRAQDHFGARYYDFLRDPRFTEQDFVDGSHLNVRGAEKFSRVLAAEVVAPELNLPPAAPASR